MTFRTSRAALLAVLIVSLLALGPAQASAAPKPKTRPINVIPITVADIQVVNNALIAIVEVGGQVVSVPLGALALPNPVDPTCPILNLQLGPIHLDLLGLNVDTSPICLVITAHEGGGLLGDLLCAVARLLSSGGPLSGLTADQLDALAQVLNEALRHVTSSLGSRSATGPFAGVSVTGPSCEILHLSLGPLDLNLLGLEVELDNCNNGPVTVDITAVPGALLGDLLCSLADLLNSSAPTNAILNALKEIAAVIATLL